MTKEQDNDVKLFKDFLKIRTTHPNPDIASCVEWLKTVAAELGLAFRTWHHKPELPVVILTKEGSEPSLPAIGLNCHMDVVPVVTERWDKLPAGETPFSAWEDADGYIYARGSQDMKCVGAQYLCALRRLGQRPLRRTVHTVWVPDEEIGGPDGMKLFALSDTFRALNIGCMLDEGLAFEEDKFVVFTGERVSIWPTLAAVGPPGHASKLIEKTAVDRLARAMARLTALRDANVEKLRKDSSLKLGDVTTVNITVIRGFTSSDGGSTFAPNVIPSDAFITCDIRIAQADRVSVMTELESIAADYELKLTHEGLEQHAYSDKNSAYMHTITSTLKQWCAVEDAIFPAATDSRYVRQVGVPAFGFSPMRKTPSLLHDHNECLNRATYLEGVDVYEKLIPALASLPDHRGKL